MQLTLWHIAFSINFLPLTSVLNWASRPARPSAACSPGDHGPHLRHGPPALEVPRPEVVQHSQAREDVQRSVHRVQVIAQPVQRFFLTKNEFNHEVFAHMRDRF